jgi:outer membrane protein TolC
MRRRLAVPALVLLLASPFLTGPGAPLAREGGEEVPAPEGPPEAAEPGGETAEEPAARTATEGDAVVLSLEEVLAAALENNLDITVRSYEPLKSAALLLGSESVFDPSVTGMGSTRTLQDPRPSSFLRSLDTETYTLAFEDPLTFGASYRLDFIASDSRSVTLFSPAGLDEINTTWRLTYTQPLLRNLGRNANRWRILVSRNNVSASESTYRQQVLDTLAAAEKAYWNLNFALMDLKTKRGSLQLAKDFLEQNRIKVRVGTLAPIEITQAEAGVADREEAVILAENAVNTAEDAVRRIINVPKDSPVWSRPIRPSAVPPLNEVTPDMAAAVEEAAIHRPDLEQARLLVRNREYEMVYRRNQRRWALDLQGIYGNDGFDPESYGDAFEDLRERNQEDWTISLTLGVPIGNRLAKAFYRETEAFLMQARLDLDRLDQLARVEVRNTVRLVETNLKRVKAAQVNVRLQREKLAAEQKKFENGMSTSFQVLQFQTDLSSAESRENAAIVDYNNSLVELERVKGTLLASRHMALPGVKENRPAGDGEGALMREILHDGIPGAAGLSLRPDRTPLPTDFTFDGRQIVGWALPGATR